MTREQILQIIIEKSREVLPTLQAHAFRPSDRLQDLGANSIDRAEIVVLVQESLALNVPLTAQIRPRNIGELAELLHEKLHSS